MILIEKTRCDKCGGYIITDATEGKSISYCAKCVWPERYLFRISDIPPIHRVKIIPDLIRNQFNGPIITHIRGIIKNPELLKAWIVLRGNPGVGKTESACFILRAAIHHKIPSLLIKVPSFLDKHRKSLNFTDKISANEFQKDRQQALNFPVVCLDDLGFSQYTESERKALYDIIWHREAYNLTTIITTGRSCSTLRNKDFLGEALMSRIKGKTKHWFIPGDRDMRGI